MPFGFRDWRATTRPVSGGPAAAEEKIENRAEKRQQNDHDDPDNLVGVVALDAVHQGDDPQDEPEDGEQVVEIHASRAYPPVLVRAMGPSPPGAVRKKAGSAEGPAEKRGGLRPRARQ